MGVAFIQGLQGDDPKYFKTIATSKHFAVHSGPESTRHTVNVEVSRHDLEDTYLPAFRATVIEGKVRIGDVRLQRDRRAACMRQLSCCRNICAMTGALRATWCPIAARLRISSRAIISVRRWSRERRHVQSWHGCDLWVTAAGTGKGRAGGSLWQRRTGFFLMPSSTRR